MSRFKYSIKLSSISTLGINFFPSQWRTLDHFRSVRMANFGGGKAFAGNMEAGVMLGAMAIHGAIQNGIAAGRQAQHNARVYNSVNRLATAFKAERHRSASLAAQLDVERAKRRLAEYRLSQK
jgi:hypothetical protein